MSTLHPFSTVAIDLTPVLPGGDNGGAKIYVLALIKQLSQIAPATQFVLLTQSLAHEELSELEQESPNIHCKQVILSKKITLSKLSKCMLRLQHLPFTRGIVQHVYYFLLDMLKYRQTHHVLKELKADLLFCPFTAPTFAQKNIPTVSVIHDLQFKTYPHFFTEQELFHRGYAFIRACNKAHTLIAVSEYSRQTSLKRQSLHPKKVITIHTQMAARVSTAAHSEQLILKRLHLTPQDYVLYPANFWKHKNHEMLLSAFQLFVKNNQSSRQIKLVCTGAPGDRQQWLQKACVAMGLEHDVVFPGFISSDNLHILMSNAAGMIFPSLYEGFGLPVIEAMAAGVPVACSNCTALPEIANDAALLFNPNTPQDISQALHTLVFDDTQRAELIRLGLIRAADFSNTEQMAKQYWDAFVMAKEKINAYAKS